MSESIDTSGWAKKLEEVVKSAKDRCESLGIDPTKAKGLVKDAIENGMKLTKCVGPHKFELVKDGKCFRCRLCYGTVGRIEKAWYERGLEHGRRSQE